MRSWKDTLLLLYLQYQVFIPKLLLYTVSVVDYLQNLLLLYILIYSKIVSVHNTIQIKSSSDGSPVACQASAGRSTDYAGPLPFAGLVWPPQLS